MNTYIPKQPKHARERIEAKLEARLVRRLERYCEYLESDRDYVLAQVLELMFRKDKGFAEWLAKKSVTTDEIDAEGRPREPRRPSPDPIREGGTD